MKKYLLVSACILMLCTILFAFNNRNSGSIMATISPIEGYVSAFAIPQEGEAVKGTMQEGKLIITVPNGTYTVQIEAAPPYKDYSKTQIIVGEGQAIDLGSIVLEKRKE